MVSLPGAPIGLPLPYCTALCPWRVAASRLRRRRAGGYGPTLTALDASTHEGHQVAPELDRVLERVESADQHRAGAGIVVVQERFGDLLRRADQRRGASGRAGDGGDRGPQALVVRLAARGQVEQPLRAGVLRPRRRPRAAAQLADALEDGARAGPGLLLGRAEDRAHRDAEARHSSGRRRGADLGDRAADRRDRLAPERVHVAVPRADREGRAGGAAEVDWDRRPLEGLDLRERAPHAVELAVEVERTLARPRAAQNLKILVGPAVAGVVIEEIAVALLLDVAAPGDDVQRDAAACHVIERGGLARGEGRRHEPGAMGDEKAQVRRRGRGVRGDHEAVGAGRAVADQHAVEPARLVDAGELGDEARVDGARDDRLAVDLGRQGRRDHPDDLDSRGRHDHCLLPAEALSIRGAPFRRVRPLTGTGFWSACMTKHPRSALRTTLATRSGESGESISRVVSAPSIRPWIVSFSTEPSTR